MKKLFLQQGDTLYFQTEIPKTATITKFDGIIQWGEHTGHKHAIEDYNEEDCLYFEDKSTGKRYLRLVRQKKIVHEEHKPIEVPVADYEIKIVLEYDHFNEEARAVLD